MCDAVSEVCFIDWPISRGNTRNGRIRSCVHFMVVKLTDSDALMIIDVQNDFLPGGSLPVPGGDRILPVLNRYIAVFSAHGLPIFASRDWHPPDHCSFETQGGHWSVHCVADSRGAAFPADLKLPDRTCMISKAVQPGREAYSAFSDKRCMHCCKCIGLPGFSSVDLPRSIVF